MNRCRKPPTNHLRMYEHYGSDGIDREISTIMSQLYKLCFYRGYSGLPHFVLSLEQIEVVRVREEVTVQVRRFGHNLHAQHTFYTCSIRSRVNVTYRKTHSPLWCVFRSCPLLCTYLCHTSIRCLQSSQHLIMYYYDAWLPW